MESRFECLKAERKEIAVKQGKHVLTGLLLLLSGALMLTRCGIGGGGGRADDSDDPANWTPASATEYIGTAGGTVTVTASTGTTFSLSIPEDATDPTTIVMTTLSGIEGFALDENIIAAVRLEPHGLSFTKPAKLTVTPRAGAVFPANAIAFVFSGSEVQPSPVFLQGGAAEIPIAHFSEVGIVDPADAISIARQQAQALLDRFMEWTDAFLRFDMEYFNQPGSRFNHWPDCSDATATINEALGLQRMGDVLGEIEIGDDAEGRLHAVLGLMHHSADITCDDPLRLRCEAAIYRYSEATGEYLSLLRQCGSAEVRADPVSLLLHPGDSAEVRFAVLDMNSQPMPGREVKVLLLNDSQTPGAITMTPASEQNTVMVTGNSLGGATLWGVDALAARLGYPELRVDVPVICSYSGISITPGRATVIGSDPATFEVAVLDPYGNEYPLGDSNAFSWDFPVWAGTVIPDPANSARATVRAHDNLLGTATISACLRASQVHFAGLCYLSIEATVTFVPDLRGTWYGTGWFAATGCKDDEDDGIRQFNNWVVSFTQTLDPLNLPASHLTGTFSGGGIGVKNLGTLNGTLGAVWDLSGTAVYSSSKAGGSAVFQGAIGGWLPGFEELSLDFTYQDTYGDTCSGDGGVTFTRSQP